MKTSLILAGVPAITFAASLCMTAISLARDEEPATPVARADRIPSGPPTFRRTGKSVSIMGQQSKNLVTLTLMTLRCLIDRCSDDDDRRTTIWTGRGRKGETELQSRDDVGNDPFLRRRGLSNDV